MPPLCRQCGDSYPALDAATNFTCAHCREQTWHFDWARAAYRTSGQVHEAVTGFKYHDQFYRRAQLVAWLVEAFDRHAAGQGWYALVPVPLHHRRRRARGFNHARELADGLGRARGLPVLDCLVRARETPQQVGLSRQGRWENVAGAFRLKREFDLTGRPLLLIDDVLTTGATTNACARVLASAGAGRRAVLTISRS